MSTSGPAGGGSWCTVHGTIDYCYMAAHIRAEVIDITGKEPGEKLLDTLDSLGYATVLLSCEEKFGIRMTDEYVDWPDTIEELAALLARQ